MSIWKKAYMWLRDLGSDPVPDTWYCVEKEYESHPDINMIINGVSLDRDNSADDRMKYFDWLESEIGPMVACNDGGRGDMAFDHCAKMFLFCTNREVPTSAREIWMYRGDDWRMFHIQHLTRRDMYSWNKMHSLLVAIKDPALAVQFKLMMS